MFYYYKSKLHYLYEQYTFTATGGDIFVLMDVSDIPHDAYDITLIAVPASECSSAAVDYHRIDGYNSQWNDGNRVDNMLKFMIEQPYKRANANPYESQSEDSKVLVFKYKDQRRKCYKILKIYQDGFLADVGDDEIRHFKWDRIQQMFGVYEDGFHIRSLE